MAARAAKRLKLLSQPCDRRAEDDYLPGNIMEIVIHNFMTYDHLVCKPGPRLSLVIGPNRSGKSSLVCAVALGLSGEPQEKLGYQILELEMNANQNKLQQSEKGNILNQKKMSLKKCMQRLNEMNNESAKLLQALKNSDVDKIFEAYNWLQGSRHQLKKEVYGPVLLEVKVPNGVHATYLENHVPNYIWKIPATVEELEAAIQDVFSEANSILFLNQNILQDYESRQQKHSNKT